MHDGPRMPAGAAFFLCADLAYIAPQQVQLKRYSLELLAPPSLSQRRSFVRLKTGKKAAIHA
jgi:hypothetical protein